MYWKLKGRTPLIQTFIFFDSKEKVSRMDLLKRRNRNNYVFCVSLKYVQHKLFSFEIANS